MGATTTDDGFHEIQLNGKQLVFLVMAVTVVLVVTFLCGVLVGRDVAAKRGPLLATAAGSSAAADAPPIPATQTQGGAPVTAKENVTYPKLLEGAAPSAALSAEKRPPSAAAAGKPGASPAGTAASLETKSANPAPVAKSPEVPPAPADKPASGANAAAAASSASPGGSSATVGGSKNPPLQAGEPTESGFAIQVAALRERAEADSVVRRLTGKGYSAYVVAPAAGTTAVYRVRVGKFKERREADAIAARLQKEEQFKPWIVR
jgi:cell division septation protein DedD